MRQVFRYDIIGSKMQVEWRLVMIEKAADRERKAYLADPCGTLSIPYYKGKSLTVPPDLRIVHQRDFSPEDWEGWQDTPYFRLYHNLSHIPPAHTPDGCQISNIDVADCSAVSELIGLCYGFTLSEAEVYSWRQRPWFRPELWLQLLDNKGQMMGAVLAEFDPEMGEGVLDWVQVHPDYRRRGIGVTLVSALLEQLRKMADFATVSGEINNPCMPEALYRRCGFSGNDVWHILRKGREP